MTIGRPSFEVTFRDHDITEVDLEQASRFGVVALDTETSGLNWKAEKIGICQLFSPGDRDRSRPIG
ncbi:MAG: hypothetical protein V2B18_16770, partial [Pseudomonadota bacterium]